MQVTSKVALQLCVAFSVSGIARVGPNTGFSNTPKPSVFEAADELCENALYTSWAKFPPGTAILHHAITTVEGVDSATSTTTRYTLRERTRQHVVVEARATTRAGDGPEIHYPPEALTSLRWVRASRRAIPSPFPSAVTAEENETTIPVMNKDLKVRAHAAHSWNELGEVQVQSWTTQRVPGGLVKSIVRLPAVGKTTTVELVELTVP